MDHNVNAASHLTEAQIDGAETACATAAAQHGVLDKAEQCDDGDLGCPTCPWRDKHQ